MDIKVLFANQIFPTMSSLGYKVSKGIAWKKTDDNWLVVGTERNSKMSTSKATVFSVEYGVFCEGIFDVFRQTLFDNIPIKMPPKPGHCIWRRRLISPANETGWWSIGNELDNETTVNLLRQSIAEHCLPELERVGTDGKLLKDLIAHLPSGNYNPYSLLHVAHLIKVVDATNPMYEEVLDALMGHIELPAVKEYLLKVKS